jgi:hypothetical protein
MGKKKALLKVALQPWPLAAATDWEATDVLTSQEAQKACYAHFLLLH